MTVPELVVEPLTYDSMKRRHDNEDDVFRALHALYEQPARQPIDYDRMFASMDAILCNDSQKLYVARLAGGIVGTALLTIKILPTTVIGELDSVVVDEASRGHGIGGALVKAALNGARREFCDTLRLTTANPDAQRLYEENGFKVIETVPMLSELQGSND